MIFFIVVLLILAVFAGGRQNRLGSLNRACRDLAAKHGGSWSNGGWFGSPSVRFRHRDASASVYIVTSGPGGDGIYTRVLLNWPEKHFRCEVFSAGTGAKFGRFGMRDVEIGSPDFDGKYVISSHDEDVVKHFLSHGVQTHIDRIRFLQDEGDVFLSVNRGTFFVKKKGVIREPELLETLVQEVLDLYDQAVMTLSRGVYFVDDTEKGCPVDGAICQICGEAIGSELVLCRRCKTPHHLDCWQYYGSCSTYACSESRYMVIKKPPAVFGRIEPWYQEALPHFETGHGVCLHSSSRCRDCVFCFAVIIIALLVSWGHTHLRDLQWLQFAKRVGGVFDSGGLLRHCFVEFTRAGHPVTLDLYSTGRQHPTYCTQVYLSVA